MFASNRARSLAIHAMADSWAIRYKALASSALLLSRATVLSVRCSIIGEKLGDVSR